MSKPVFDAMVKTGSYKDRDGNDKNRWLKIGSVFEGEKGLSMLLDCVPVGVQAPVWVSFFEIKPKGDRAQTDNSGRDDTESGIPF